MAVSLILSGHTKDLGGGYMIQRLLPAAERPGVGPFVFMDHFGPVTQRPEDSFDVRPHPHIGLATVTYLFEGAMVHRDSLGSVQRIEPGAINWMTAGRGIVHSERSPEELRVVPKRIHGLQLWVGLPLEFEEIEPGFAHTPAAAIPVVATPLPSQASSTAWTAGKSSWPSLSSTRWPMATALLPDAGANL